MDRLLQRIEEICKYRGWSEYRLAAESGVSQTTISQWYSNKRKSYPTVDSLKRIAEAFGITMSLLFADGNQVYVSDDDKRMLELWSMLEKPKRNAIIEMLEVFTKTD